MGTYKISDLESLSGVKAHTIRIWEQRYSILHPLRTTTNIRYYDDEQLRRLLTVVSLVNAGDKISSIGKLSQAELNAKVVSLSEEGNQGVKEEMLINQMITAGLAYDETSFEKAFSNSILSFGLLTAYERIFYPLIFKIGLLWSTSELMPSQEHFVSNLIKQKLFSAIDALDLPIDDQEKWLLFLPEGERHEIGLLVANYALRASGVKVFYLGADVPMDNLYTASEELRPTHYLTFSVKTNQKKAIQEYLGEMKNNFNDPTIYLCCQEQLKNELTFSNRQKALSSFPEFQALMESMKSN